MVDLINSLDCLFLILIAFIFSICFTCCLLTNFAFYYIRILTALTFFYSYPYISSSLSVSSLSVSIISSAMMLARLLFIYFKDFNELIFFIFIPTIKCFTKKIVIVIANLMMPILLYNTMRVNNYNRKMMPKWSKPYSNK
jgi:hypothetical protein